MRALEEADPQKRTVAWETAPKRVAGRSPKVGDDMVLLDGTPEVGFKLLKEEIHNEAASAAVEGLTKGL